MARLVSSVIELARDRHASFDEQRQPSGPLYRFLGSFIQELETRIAKIDSTVAGVEAVLSYALPLQHWTAGFALGANRTVVSVAMRDATETPEGAIPVDVIDARSRFTMPPRRTFVWQLGDRLYLSGTSREWPSGLDTIDVTVIQPFDAEDLAGLEDPDAMLPLPDDAANACACALAAFMAGRVDGFLPTTLQQIVAERDAAIAAFLDGISQRNATRTFTTIDAMGDMS